MLSVLIIQLLVTFCCVCAGFLFYDIIDKRPRNLIIYCISGLIIITIISQAIALFMPVKGFLFPVLALLLLIYAFLNRKLKDYFSGLFKQLKELPVQVKITCIVLWLMFSLISAGPVMMADTETYHIQMIKWINEYGSVPGMVNLHERFGFNSSWFSTIAFFNFGGVINLYTTINGLLSVWLCFYLVGLIQKQSNEPGKNIAIAAFILLIFGLAFWPFIRGNAATANYDHISALVVFVLFLESFKSRQDNTFSSSIEWIIWPVFLFSVRVINFPLILLCIYGLVQLIKRKEYRTMILIFFTGMLIIVPFLWRNIILTGYPFYPSFAFNFFDVDWKADSGMMNDLLDYIKYYNRVSTAYMDLEQTRALGQTGWIPSWFRHLFIYDKIIVGTGVAGIIAALISGVRNREWSKSFLYFLTVMILFIITWFLVAPDPRFIYGCLFAGTFGLFYHVASLLRIDIPKRIKNAMFILLSVSVIIYMANKLISEEHYINWITPTELPVPPTNDIERNGILFHIPQKINNNWNARCYGTELPCLYIVHPDLEPRGGSISEGFRLKK